MCQIGDIILIKKYENDGATLNRHSFVVISDEADVINGLSFDMICNVMSSFKDEAQRDKKLRFSCNFPISHDDSIVKNGNAKDGFIKSDQLYYFNKSKIKYEVIGKLKPDIFNALIKLIEESDFELKEITDNL